MKAKIVTFSLAFLLTISLLPGCTSPAQKLPIFHAGSLAIPWAQVSEEFNRLYPDVEILAEAAGSATTIRKVTELDKKAGVIGSSDYTLIPKLMFPEYADWYIIFATNQMVLSYTDKSQFGDEINADNWYQILQRDGVRYGRSDPDQDPAGYRTLMAWQLAEDYYNVPALYDKLISASGNTMRPKETDLIALLESGDLDYAFEYASLAIQHGLKYVALPPEINLSSEKFKEFYATAEVEIRGTEPGQTITLTGEPIFYAVTIPKNYPDQKLAIKWVDFLLSDKGMAIIKANGQPPVKPVITNDRNKLPEQLRKYAE